MEAFWTVQRKLVGRIDAEFYTSEFVNAEERLLSHIVTRPFSELWKEYNRIYIGIAGFDSISSEKEYTPYIRPTDIGDDGEIDYENLPWCKREWLDDYAPKGCAKPGDLLVEVKGNTRRAAVISERIPPNCLVSGSAYRIQVVDGADPHFIQAYLLSTLGQTLKRRLTSNTTISYIDPESFQDYRIPYPSDPIQKAIGNKMRKGELLRGNADDAKQQATAALYNLINWPIKLSEESSSFTNTRELASRIDAKFYLPRYLEVRAHIRALRMGWHPFLHHIETVANGCEVREFIEQGRPYLCVGDITDGELDVIGAPQIDWAETIPKKALIQEGDLLIVRTGSLGQSVSIRASDASTKAAISSHFIRIVLNEPQLAPTLAFFFNSEPARLLQQQITYGAVQPQLSQDDVMTVPIPDFDSDAQAEIGGNYLKWREYLEEASQLVVSGKRDVEALIDGTLDEVALLRESEEIDRWFKENRT